MLRRIVFLTEAQEICQSFALSHVRQWLLIHTLKAVTAVHITLQIISFYYLILPLAAAARLNDYLYIVRQFHIQQLTDILCGTAPFTFQITSTQIPVNCPFIPTV